MRHPRRPGGPAAILSLLVLLLAGAVLVLLANPRHRAFYFGRPPASPGGPPTFRLPAPPRFGRTPETPGVSPVAAVGAGHRVPLPSEGWIRIPLADRLPARLPAEGVPPGWTLKEFAGRAAVELVRGEEGLAVRLRSVHSSFVLFRDVIADVTEYPLLTWSWRVVTLPRAGDVRAAATDDEAAQVYVVFPRWPAPLQNSEVIGYVWDSRAPVGTRLVSPKAPNVRIVVVESGAAHLDTWLGEVRNVAEDYAALFGRRPPRVGQVALMIDTDDTRGQAEAYFGGLAFTKQHGERIEKPTSMLR